MSSKNQNYTILAVAIVIFAFVLVMFTPIILEQNQQDQTTEENDLFQKYLNNNFAVFMTFSLGFMFLVFIFIVLAIKQRRNIYG